MAAPHLVGDCIIYSSNLRKELWYTLIHMYCCLKVQNIAFFLLPQNPPTVVCSPPLHLPTQLCVVMIFLVTVVMCRGIISLMLFRTGSPVLRTEVHHSSIGVHFICSVMNSVALKSSAHVCVSVYEMCILDTGTCVWSPLQAGTIANVSSSVVNLGLILLMGRVYTALAEQLTKWGKNQYCSPTSRMLYIYISLSLELH